MDFRQATLSQLYEIAYHDTECWPIHKRQAAEEILRRKNNKNSSKNRRTFVNIKLIPAK